MNYQPEIAIVEANTLTCLGLKGILEEMIPMATIRTFHHFSELMDDTPDMYAHYFISAQIYVEHNAFFLPRKRKTIVLPAYVYLVPFLLILGSEWINTGELFTGSL